VGVGDLSGTVVSSIRSDRIFMTQQRLQISMPMQMASGWVLTPRLGPTYMFLDHSSDQTMAIDVAETGTIGVVMPRLDITRHDQIQTHYLGLMGGIGASRRLSDRSTLSIGLGYWRRCQPRARSRMGRIDLLHRDFCPLE
jgi:hypothetical protein